MVQILHHMVQNETQSQHKHTRQNIPSAFLPLTHKKGLANAYHFFNNRDLYLVLLLNWMHFPSFTPQKIFKGSKLV